MRVQPLRWYPTPAYPTMEEARLDPELLRRLPARWRGNRVVMSALAALTALSVTACSAGEEKDAPAFTDGAVASVSSATNSPRLPAAAPVFGHGEGTGALGCVMVAPPAFMSEQEALAIIRGEAAAAGLRLEDRPKEYTAPPRRMENELGEAYLLGTPVGLDASDEQAGVAVAFVSMTEGRQPARSSVTQYLARERAEQAAADWAGTGAPYVVGTFYDPGVSAQMQDVALKQLGEGDVMTGSRQQAYLNAVREEQEANLRAQVRDFIEWLQGQGVL